MADKGSVGTKFDGVAGPQPDTATVRRTNAPQAVRFDGATGPQIVSDVFATRVAATRTLAYKVSGRVSTTRAINYSITGRVSATRTLQYAVGLFRVTTTRTLAYAIVGRVAATRSVRYQILTPPFRISATRRLQYTIIGRPASTRTLFYDIATGLEPAGRFSLAFDQGALQWDEAVWTRIDDYPNLVTSYQIDRGRSYELDRTDTGRATVVITDQDGILDPTNPAGPFYGRIQPLIQARIGRRNPVTGEWRTRYRGYVEDLTYQFDPSQHVNRLTITLVDQFEILSAIEMQPGRFGGGTTADGQIKFNTAGVQARIKGVLHDAGLEAHAYVVFTGNVDVSQVVYSAGESPMTVIQECADAEFPGVSNVYCDRKGRLVFHGRFAKFAPDEVAAGASSGAWDFQRWKIGDGQAVHASPADTAQLRSFGFNRGLSKIINQATASPTGIADADVAGQMVEDTTSIHDRGIRSWSAPNLVTHRSAIDDSDANTETKRFATYYVANYNVPHDRIQDVSVRSLRPDDLRAGAVWKLMGEIDISDAVAVTVDSPGGGGFVAAPYFVEGVHETCQPATGTYDDVTLTLDLSPAAYYTTNPWPGKVTSTRQLQYKVQHP